MVSLIKLASGAYIFSKLDVTQRSTLVRYGLPIAVGAILIQVSRPKSLVERIVSKLIS